MTKETLATFIERNRLTLFARLVDTNPSMSDMPVGSTHWKCEIRQPSTHKSMTLHYSKGPGLGKAPPTLTDVLESVHADVSGFDGTSFEDWCTECGFSDDSRKAEKTYNSICKEMVDLKRLLGDDGFKEFVAIEVE